jgi:hypothetical protein
MTRKAVKGSVIADHLADNAVEDYEPLDFDFPDENLLVIEEEEEKTDWWTMFFDGAVNVYGNGVGAMIISHDQKLYPVSVKLHFEFTNNTVEYEAYILSLEAALEMKIRKVDVYGDSMLIICQVKGEWQTKEYLEGVLKMDKKTLRRLAMGFYLNGEILYKRSFNGTLLRFLNVIDAS